MTVAEYSRAVQEARCNYEQRCQGQRGVTNATLDGCLREIAGFETVFDLLVGESFADYANRIYTAGSEADMQACIARFTTEACDSTNTMFPACDAAVEVTNPVASGGLCDEDELRCEDDTQLCRRVSGTPCRRCQPRPALGDACNVDDDCYTRQCAANGFCTEPIPPTRGRGVACTTDADCFGAFVCAGSTGAKTCTDLGGVGALCEGGAVAADARVRPPCAKDLDCVTGVDGLQGTCTARLDRGATCRRDAVRRINTPAAGWQDLRTFAGCKEFCVFPDSTSATGTCGIPASVSTGNPCTAYRGEQATLCKDTEPTTYADLNFALETMGMNKILSFTECQCATRAGLGQPCWFSDDCSEGYCAGATLEPVVEGTCSAKKPLMGACTFHEECVSGACGSNGKCIDARGNGQQCVEDLNCISGFCNLDVMPAVCASAVCQ